MKKHPNILILLSDQHRWNTLGCYGNEDVISPSFDRMAAEGVRFTNSVSASPVCSPFRGTLQTGLYPHQHGIVRNNLRFREGLTYLAERFNAHGYASCYIGKAHWHDSGSKTDPGYIPPKFRCGWQTWYGENRGHYQFDMPDFDENGEQTHRYRGRYEPEVQTELATDFIHRQGEHPWIMQLNWGGPHNASQNHLYVQPHIQEKMRQLNRELGLGLPDEKFDPDKTRFPSQWIPQQWVDPIVPERYMDMYDRDTLTLDPNVDENLRACMPYRLHEYYAMVTSLDDQLARILSLLNEVAPDTIVVYTSDHGDVLGTFGQPRGKARPVQNAYRTPLIVWGPSRICKGVTTDNLVNSVDLVPTLLDLAGLPVTDDLPGVSAAGWCTGDTGRRQENVLLGLDNWRALLDGRFCYAIEARDGRAEPIRLTDVVRDPGDSNNLVGQSEFHETQARLHRVLMERLAAVNDHDFLHRCGDTAANDAGHGIGGKACAMEQQGG